MAIKNPSKPQPTIEEVKEAMRKQYGKRDPQMEQYRKQMSEWLKKRTAH